MVPSGSAETTGGARVLRDQRRGRRVVRRTPRCVRPNCCVLGLAYRQPGGHADGSSAQDQCGSEHDRLPVPDPCECARPEAIHDQLADSDALVRARVSSLSSGQAARRAFRTFRRRSLLGPFCSLRTAALDRRRRDTSSQHEGRHDLAIREGRRRSRPAVQQQQAAPGDALRTDRAPLGRGRRHDVVCRWVRSTPCRCLPRVRC